VPRAVFDYTDGAAGDESGLTRARRAFTDVQFDPRVLRDVSTVDTSTEIFGVRSSMPLILGPTGFTRMMHYRGEIAVAAVAARERLPYGLSTLGTTSIEGLAAADTARSSSTAHGRRDIAPSSSPSTPRSRVADTGTCAMV